MITHYAKYKDPDRTAFSSTGAADWSASLQKPPDTVTWIQQQEKRESGKKDYQHSFLLWAHLLVEQMQLVLKEKRGEEKGSIRHIPANTIDLSVMGLLRAVHALFSQKAVLDPEREDQPETSESRDQTHYQRDVTTRGERIQIWWVNHDRGRSHSDESALENNSE